MIKPDSLRILGETSKNYASVGRIFCAVCGQKVAKLTASEATQVAMILNDVKKFEESVEKRRAQNLAAQQRHRQKEEEKRKTAAASAGVSICQQTSATHNLTSAPNQPNQPNLPNQANHSIYQPNQTKPNQTKPNQTKSTEPNRTEPNRTEPKQTATAAYGGGNTPNGRTRTYEELIRLRELARKNRERKNASGNETYASGNETYA